MIPAAVKQANEAADAAMESFVKQQQDGSTSATTLDDATKAPVDQTPAAPETEPKAEKPREPDFRHMYQTLKGKYNAEVPRLQNQLNELQAQMTQVLTNRPTQESAAVVEAPKGPGHSRYLKKEELEQYGDEILDMQARMAKGVAEDVVEREVANRVAPIIDNMGRLDALEDQVQSSADARFWSLVESQVPGARNINDSDPLWFEFLDAIEPGTGLQYRQIGETAYNKGDSGRMVRLMQVFLGSSEGEASATPVAKPPVKPGKVADKNATPPVVQSKPRIRESEIQAFYSDVARGKYRGRDDERKARELVIESAVEEGRMVRG